MNTYTMEEVNKHNKKQDCWIVIRGMVYDVTDFLKIHPGGSNIIISVAGEDATEYFEELHREEVLEGVGRKYIIGELISSKL